MGGMRVLSINKDEGQFEIVVARVYLFFIKTKSTYIATRSSGGPFYLWAEMPNKIIVSDPLSFQLDAWLRDWSENTTTNRG